jgi:hypothetical protein
MTNQIPKVRESRNTLGGQVRDRRAEVTAREATKRMI